MRINELYLNEAATEYKDIQTVSRYVADYMIAYKPTKYITADEMANKLSFPQIQSGVLINLLFDVDLMFGLISPKQADGAIGWYEPEQKSIVVDRRMVRHKSELITTIAHEIQHAIDDFKSSGSALRRAKNAPSVQDDFGSYLRRPQEINARFTQALLDIVDAEARSKYQIGRVGTPKETMRDIVPLVFGKNHLAQGLFNDMPNGDQKYKRLLSRAYKFYDEVKDMIDAEPDQPKTSLVAKAKELIRRYIS